MAKINHHYTKLSGSYLFPEIERKAEAYRAKYPTAQLINLGIGDIARPLPPAIVAALESAAREMGVEGSFKGYGPSQGYSFLREAIAEFDYPGTGITADEIFISDGAKSDFANIQEIFALENRIALPDPTYPVYVESNVMAGRTRSPIKTGGYGGVIYLPCTQENDFIPEIPNRPCDLIYLCSPSNPTGVAMDRENLKKWVDYAQEVKAVILFDGAYEAYVRSPNCPRSIFEIPGAEKVAIEIRSFSKTAGFTGLRCSYLTIPHALKISHGYQTFSAHALWKRRQETKFNGVSYPVQKAAAAVYSPKGREEVKQIIDSYLWQAAALRKNLEEMGHAVFGGIDAPYLWLKAPPGYTSWDFFDRLLTKTQILSIPGSGFGTQGEGFVRLSTFANAQTLSECVKRLKTL